MNDADITKLIAKLITILPTKEDLQDVKQGLDRKIDNLEVRLEGRIDNLDKKLSKAIHVLDKKADTILEYAEAVDETVDKHEKRLRNIERIPVVAHELKKPS